MYRNILFPVGSTKEQNEKSDPKNKPRRTAHVAAPSRAGNADKRCRICNGDELCAMFASERRAFFMMQGEGRRISRAKTEYEEIPW